MAITQNTFTGNGSNLGPFSFTFKWLESTDIKVTVAGVLKTVGTHYNLQGLNYTTKSGGQVLFTAGNAPANGAAIVIYRQTDDADLVSIFFPGSAIRSQDLNDNFTQNLYVTQEANNNVVTSNTTANTALSTANTALSNSTAAVATANTASTNASNAVSTANTASSNASAAVATANTASSNASAAVATANTASSNATAAVNTANTTAAQFAVLDANVYDKTELDGGQLDNRYYTETELNSGALDSQYFRQDSSETINSGMAWSGSDSYIATTKAIDARIVDLVDDVGGFVPIANENSFPASNPDINNPDGSGTIVSIKEISSTRTPSSGTVTIANGSSSNTVTINGCGSTVLAAGFGVLVETTSTLHTYTFHRLVPKATEVTTVASISGDVTAVAANSTNVTAVATNASNINSVAGNATNINAVNANSANINSAVGNATNINAVSANSANINTVAGNNANVTTVAGSITNVNTVATNLSSVNSFANLYRIGTSDPTTSLDAGDLVFNTTTKELRVYNGTAWQAGVTATGNLVSKNGDTMTGPLLVPLGTAALPALAVSGDPNTGLYSPGADQVAISTGGTGRVFVDASGRVGLGTSAQWALLSIPFSNAISFGNATYPFSISRDGTGALVTTFSDAYDTTAARVDFVMRSGSAGQCTPLSISGANRVGIGNAAPAMSLHVGPGASSFTTTDGGGVNVTPQVFNSQTSGVAALGVGVVDGTNNRRASLFVDQPNSIWGLSANYSSGEPSFVIRAASNERVRIDSSGRLGLGTSSPQAILSTKPSASTTTAATTFTGDGVYIDCANTTDSNGSYGGAISWSRSGSSTTRAAAICNVQTAGDSDVQGLAFLTHASTTSTNPLIEAMRITGAGNVGIGTTSVETLLHLRSDSASAVDHLFLQNATGGAGSESRIAFSASTAGYSANRFSYIGVTLTGAGQNGHNLVFATNANGESATEKARVTSDGKLLVGTSSARTTYDGSSLTPQVQVEGTTGGTSHLALCRNAASVAGPALVLGKTRQTAAGQAIDTAVLSGDVLGTIQFEGADGADFVTAASISAVADGEFNTSGDTTDGPGRLVIATTSDGSSSPTERLRITRDGVQCYRQSEPVTETAAVTLTAAELKTGIIVHTISTSTNLTLPTGADIEAAFAGMYTDMTFNVSIIAAGAGSSLVQANTGVTITGSATVANAGTFAIRRTAANTFIAYRIS